MLPNFFQCSITLVTARRPIQPLLLTTGERAGVTAGYLFMKIIFNEDAYAPAMLIGSVLAAVTAG